MEMELVRDEIQSMEAFENLKISEFEHGVVHVHCDFLNNFSRKVALLITVILDENREYEVSSNAFFKGEGFNAVITFRKKSK